ncbi:MAG: DUF58 domain-containing protein [Planctomycetota bacterium]
MAGSSRYSDPEVLARIKRLELRAKHAVQGTLSGVNRSPRLGQSVEFVDYREYAPGDDLKRLDWRVYARTNRWCVKLFEEESNLRATLVLDASRSMRYRGTGSALSKWDYAATVCASLATLAVDQRDAAGLCVFDRDLRDFLPPVASRPQVLKIVRRLEEAAPDRETELGAALRAAARELPRRGLIFIVSDFLTDLDDFFAAMQALTHRAHDVVLLHVLDRDEIALPFDDQVEFVDLEGADRLMAEPKYFRSVYRDAMRDFCQQTEDRAGEIGADYLLMTTDTDIGLALSFYLDRRRRLAVRGSRRGGRLPVTGGGSVKAAFRRLEGETP